MFTIDLDLSGVQRDWNEALGVLSDGIRRGVKMAIDEGIAEAKSNHEYRDQTGTLTRSMRSRMGTSTRGGAEGYMVALAKHASYVERGTRPHDIRPKEGEGFKGPMRRGQSRRDSRDIGTHRVALRWTQGGRVRFAKVVHHPGSRPYAVLGMGYLKAERVLQREIEIAQEKMAAIMNRD